MRSGEQVESKLPVVQGWQHYYRAEYSAAKDDFLRQEGRGWLKAWAELGVAKVASDCGKWPLGLLWCAQAWRTAAVDEHLDLLSEIAGARGEILLRAGRPAAAAASFAEDLGLLTPGNRYRGRVRCYLAHAWSRMGSEGKKAAKLAYRIAAHSSGESGTMSFAMAGLAILAARSKLPELLSEPVASDLTGLSAFWVHVSQARLSTIPEEAESLKRRALDLLPPVYHAERWWLSGWTSCDAIDHLSLEALELDTLPEPENTRWTAVELPVHPGTITDAPWWFPPESWPPDAEGWWSFRDGFMP